MLNEFVAQSVSDKAMSLNFHEQVHCTNCRKISTCKKISRGKKNDKESNDFFRENWKNRSIIVLSGVILINLNTYDSLIDAIFQLNANEPHAFFSTDMIPYFKK